MKKRVDIAKRWRGMLADNPELVHELAEKKAAAESANEDEGDGP